MNRKSLGLLAPQQSPAFSSTKRQKPSAPTPSSVTSLSSSSGSPTSATLTSAPSTRRASSNFSPGCAPTTRRVVSMAVPPLSHRNPFAMCLRFSPRSFVGHTPNLIFPTPCSRCPPRISKNHPSKHSRKKRSKLCSRRVSTPRKPRPTNAKSL